MQITTALSQGKSMFVVFTLIVVVSLNRYVLSTTTCMEALADLFAKNHLMHRCKFTPAGYSASKPSFPWLNPSFQKIERIGRSARFQYGHIELPSVESIGSEDELISLLLGNFFGYCEETNVYFTITDKLTDCLNNAGTCIKIQGELGEKFKEGRDEHYAHLCCSFQAIPQEGSQSTIAKLGKSAKALFDKLAPTSKTRCDKPKTGNVRKY